MSPPQANWICIVSAPFAENTFVGWREGSRECVVVDPGLEPDKILELLEKHQLTPTAMLLTHGHADHIGGNRTLKERFPQCPLVIGEGDQEKLTDAWQNLSAMFGTPITSPPADTTVREGDVYEVAGFRFLVREIPGHSSGHVVYICRDDQPAVVLGGDVLFAGSVGRTDFPDGDFDLLAAGIHRKLFDLPDDTRVLNGHGPVTTIGRERVHNPFVGRAAGYQPLA